MRTMLQFGSRKVRPGRVFGAGVLLAVVGVAGAQGCSVVTNATAVQCTSEAECLSLGPDFKDTTCDKETKTCKKVQAALECETNAQCAAKGPSSICRKSDHKCISLLSPECPRVIGKPEQIADDNAIILGLISPAGSGELGDALEKGAELAQLEVSPTTTGTGIPTKGGSTRPVIMVSCHEFNANGITGLLAAAEHLVKTVEVPVVIGPVDPTDAQIVATNVTLPNKVLNISPGAITSNLQNLPNPIAPTPLLWRPNYGDQEQLKVLQSFIAKELTPKLKADGMLGANEPLRIAIIAEGDYKGLQMADVVRTNLTWNTKADGTTPATCLDNLNKSPSACLFGNFGSLNDTLGNPSPEGKIAGVLGGVFAGYGSNVQPHIILHSYATFGITRVLFPIEAAWKSSPAKDNPNRPYHIGLYPPFNTFEPMFGFMDTWSRAEKAAGERPFNERMFAFSAHSDVDPADVERFKLNFITAFQDFSASATPGDILVRLYYDSAYLAIYGVAALNDKPISGPNIAATLPRLVSGQQLKVGSEGILAVFNALANPDTTIDLQGVSGSLNFNPITGAPTYSVELTCPGSTADSKPTNFVPSGYYYDAVSEVVQGAGTVFDKTNTKCPFLKN